MCMCRRWQTQTWALYPCTYSVEAESINRRILVCRRQFLPLAFSSSLEPPSPQRAFVILAGNQCQQHNKTVFSKCLSTAPSLSVCLRRCLLRETTKAAGCVCPPQHPRSVACGCCMLPLCCLAASPCNKMHARARRSMRTDMGQCNPKNCISITVTKRIECRQKWVLQQPPRSQHLPRKNGPFFFRE